MPMEKEIAALKDKLTEAEEKIKELEASKVVELCNPCVWNPRLCFHALTKIRITKGENSVI